MSSKPTAEAEPGPWESTATDLLRDAQQMDQAAWIQLVDRYAPLVCHWCRQSGIDGTATADIVQDVFLQLSISLPRFRKDGRSAAFRRWLRALTSSKIADFKRAEAKQAAPRGGSTAAMELKQFPVEDEKDNADSRASQANGPSPNAEALRHLTSQIRGEFAAKTWQAFWLTTIENYSSPEAASILDMTQNAVRLAKSRVLRRLREVAQPNV